MVGGGLWAVPAIAGAWTFDATLGVWRERAAPAVTSSPGIEAGRGPNRLRRRPSAPLPTPMVERTPTDVEIVNKAINPGASDPNVPLPRANLLADGAGNEPRASSGPRIYGRGEDGGGVLGLRAPHSGRSQAGATAR